MSAADKPISAGATLFVVKRLAEDEAKRIEALTDDELRAETRAGRADGREPWRPSSTEELLARVRARAPHPGARRIVPAGRRSTAVVWLAAAAVALVVGVAAVKGPAIVAYLRGPTIRRDDDYVPQPTPSEVAAGLREDARSLCERGEFEGCEGKLDEAKRVDPGGEADPRVLDLRQEIEVAKHPVLPAPEPVPAPDEKAHVPSKQ